MYVIFESKKKQYYAEEGKTITVDLLDQEEGSNFETDQILLFKDGNDVVKTGMPLVEGVKITGKVLQHMKDNKIVVFKKKRRKGYRKTQGHRQKFTQIQIEKIIS